jgi:hypothetical protein
MDKNKNGLELRIRRIRTRLAASVKTGQVVNSQCPIRTDPTGNGEMCPTGALVCKGGTQTFCGGTAV